MGNKAKVYYFIIMMLAIICSPFVCMNVFASKPKQETKVDTAQARKWLGKAEKRLKKLDGVDLSDAADTHQETLRPVYKQYMFWVARYDTAWRAAPYLDEALSLARSSSFYELIGRMAEQVGQYDRAKKAYQKAINILNTKAKRQKRKHMHEKYSDEINAIRQTHLSNFFPFIIAGEYERTKVYEETILPSARKTTYKGLRQYRNADYRGPYPGYNVTDNNIYVDVYEFDSTALAKRYIKEEVGRATQKYNYTYHGRSIIYTTRETHYGTDMVEIVLADQIGSRVIELWHARSGQGISVSISAALQRAKQAHESIIRHVKSSS